MIRRVSALFTCTFLLWAAAAVSQSGEDSGTATVYMYRYNEADHRFSAGVYINETKAAKLGNGRWVKFELEPGT